MRKNLPPLLFFIVLILSVKISVSQQILQWNNYSAYFRIHCMLDLDTAVLAGTEFNGLVSINKFSNTVTYINNSNSGFRGNMIHALAKSDSGKIWVGSYCGLSMLSGGTWTLYTSQNSPMPINSVTALHYSPNTHSLWVGFENGYIMRIDTSGWNLIIGQNGSTPSGYVNSIVTDNSGNIWASTRFNGLYKYDGTDWILYNSSNSILTGFIQSMAIDHIGNVWVANTWKLVKFDGSVWTSYNPGIMMFNYISVDTNNVIWCSTEAGVRTFNGTTWNYLPFNIYLTTHNINCHLWDKNFFWTGTEDNGVDHITINTTNVVNFPLIPGIPYPHVNSIDFESGSNKTWFGIPTTWGNGFSGMLCNFDGTTWQQYNTNNSDLHTDIVKSICTDTNHTIWIGTADTGLYCLHGNSWSHFTKQNSGLHNNEISTLGKDCGIGLIIGFLDGTVQTLQNNTFQTIIQSNQVNCSINKIITDQNGEIWIATVSAGILRYFNSNLVIYNSANAAITSNHINDIKIDTLQHYWIATDAGIVCFDGISSWTTYNTLNSGLPDNDVNAIAIGLDNSLWAGLHFDGLAHFDGNTWTTYNECSSQLAGNDIMDMKTSADGDIYIGTNRGVNIISIDYITGQAEINDRKNVRVFPNPGSGKINFEFRTDRNKNAELEIFNTQGQLVFHKVLQSNNMGIINWTWDVSIQNQTIPAGLYYYSIQGNFQPESGKVMVVR